MYPAKSLAMYPFWGFFRLLKVGTKVQQCTQIGDVAVAALVGERQSTGDLFATGGRAAVRFLAISFKHPPPPHLLDPSKGTLRKDYLLRFVFHLDIRKVFLNVA